MYLVANSHDINTNKLQTNHKTSKQDNKGQIHIVDTDYKIRDFDTVVKIQYPAANNEENTLSFSIIVLKVKGIGNGQIHWKHRLFNSL